MASWNTSSSSRHISSLPAPVQSSTQPPYVTPSSHPEASDGHSEFPYKLFDVMGFVTSADLIRWHQDGGLFIPNVVEFVDRVLRTHFPDMKKGWPSFQKQMSNYGFEKRDRARNRAHYVHWDNKFRSGRPDLLSQVQPRRKEPTSTYPGVQGEPPAPNTPEVPQPLDQLNPDDKLEHLQNKVAELERRLRAKESEEQPKVAELKERLKVAEAEAAKVPELEKRLEATKVEAAKVPDLERQLREMGALINQVLSPGGGGSSIMSGSPYTQVHTGLVGGPVSSNLYPMGGAGNSSGIHGGFTTPGWPIDPYGGAAQLRGVPHHMAPGMPFTGINPAIPQQSVQLPNNAAPFPSSSRTSHYAAGLPAFQVPMWMQDSSIYGAGPTSLPNYAQQQNIGPWPGAQTFPPNGFVLAPSSQAQTRPPSSSSPRTSSTRQPLGLSGVPPPSPPAPGLARLGYISRAFGLSNSGQQ